MLSGPLAGVATGNSVICPAGVMRPILLPCCSVNQRLPSGAVQMPSGKLPDVGTGNSVICPAVVIRPILLPWYSVNQRLPSGPLVMRYGWLPWLGRANSVMLRLATTEGVAFAVGVAEVVLPK